MNQRTLTITILKYYLCSKLNGGMNQKCYRLIRILKNATVTFWNIVLFSLAFVLCWLNGRLSKNKRKDKESISVELEETDT